MERRRAKETGACSAVVARITSTKAHTSTRVVTRLSSCSSCNSENCAEGACLLIQQNASAGSDRQYSVEVLT